MTLRLRTLSLLPVLFAASVSSAAPLLTLDASNLSTLSLSGSSVNGWTNASGGQTFTPLYSSVAAPTYVSNAINGQGAVSFNGTNPLSDLGFASTATTYTALTFFLVVAPRSNGGGYNAFLSDRTDGNNDYSTGFNLDMGSGSSTSFSTFNAEGAEGGGGGGVNLKTDSSPFGAFQLLSLTYSATAAQLYVNGVAEGSRGNGANAFPLSNLVVGGRYYTNSPTGGYYGFLDGEIANIQVYSGALSDADRQSVEAGLRAKYFTPTPEPTTWAALGLGAAAFVRRRRK